MEFYQPVLERLETLIQQYPDRREYSYDETKRWPETKRFELIMARDAAYELGASGTGAANYTCVTMKEDHWTDNKTIVIGSDLNEIATDTSYARLVVLQLEEGLLGDTTSRASSEQAFHTLQKLDFIKYHVFPKGYMIRTSAETFREQVRVQNEALREGITFEQLGNTFLKHYLEVKGVKAATVVFLTDPAIDYEALKADARKVHEITLTFSRILEGIPTDCSICSLKPICDEVEGMRELHFGKQEMGGRKSVD